jgi:predicted dehydrogenase
MKTTRRQFIKSSAVAASAVTFPAASWARVGGANDDIRVAVVGFNSRGKDHIEGFKKLRGVRIVALCDVDSKVLEAGAARFAAEGNPVQTFTDVRKLLESKEIDAISTATPNHWHALISIWACMAGKDVYVEKPVSHNVWEGRQIVNAARKFRRIVQTGTQSRSSPSLQAAIAWQREGHIGKITLARGLCYKPRQSIGKVSTATSVPSHIDYDLWCGPTPKHPLMRQKLHYDWHWVYETGNGDVGNQGIHQMDIARWFLGEERLSSTVLSVGGRLGYEDDGNTPNTQFVFHDYKTAPLVFEVRGLPKSREFQTNDLWSKNMPDYRGVRIGVVIDCEGGSIVIPTYENAVAYDKEGKVLKKFDGGGNHYANFISAVRSRDHRDLHADIEEGHISSALCHTGNISHRLGEKLGPGALKERIAANPLAAEAYGRMSEHLEANGVDLGRDELVLGAYLRMDPKSERFIGNHRADELLRDPYRAPFAVPAISLT